MSKELKRLLLAYAVTLAVSAIAVLVILRKIDL